VGLLLSYSFRKGEFLFIKLIVFVSVRAVLSVCFTEALQHVLHLSSGGAETKRGGKDGNVTTSLIKNTWLVKYVQNSRHPRYLPHLRRTSCCLILLKCPENTNSIWFKGTLRARSVTVEKA